MRLQVKNTVSVSSRMEKGKKNCTKVLANNDCIQQTKIFAVVTKKWHIDLHQSVSQYDR